MSTVGENVYGDNDVHGVYGEYKQADANDREAGGMFRSLETGQVTIGNDVIQRSADLYLVPLVRRSIRAAWKD